MGTAFKGTSGDLLSITVVPNEELEVGATYTGTVKTVTIVDVDGNKYVWDDTTFTITVGEPDDGRVKLDENSTVMPEEASDVNVTVLRTINADEWSTICLPFDVSAEQMATAFGEGVEVKLADFKGTEPTYDDDDNVVSVKANFESTTAIEANHPYIIRVSDKVSEIKVDNVTIAPDDVLIEFDNGKTGSRRVVYSGFYGTYVAETLLDANTLFLNSNKFYYSTGKTKMKAFRAYFDFLDVLPEFETAGSKISFFVDDAPTRINGLTRDGIEDGAVYTLGGQLVGKDVRIDQLPKGVYIINGKKRVVK